MVHRLITSPHSGETRRLAFQNIMLGPSNTMALSLQALTSFGRSNLELVSNDFGDLIEGQEPGLREPLDGVIDEVSQPMGGVTLQDVYEEGEESNEEEEEEEEEADHEADNTTR